MEQQKQQQISRTLKEYQTHLDILFCPYILILVLNYY